MNPFHDHPARLRSSLSPEKDRKLLEFPGESLQILERHVSPDSFRGLSSLANPSAKRFDLLLVRQFWPFIRLIKKSKGGAKV